MGMDVDAMEALGDEIATLAAHIAAATHRLLSLIAEFDRLRGWESGGHRSCAHWLAFRTGIDLGAAREKVRAARALESLPLMGAAMSQGELSFSQVRALTRVATPETEPELLAFARGATTAQLERMVRTWKKGRRADEAAAERERFESRTLSVFPDDDGMYVIRGVLTPEVAAVLMRAVDAASDALFRRDSGVDPAQRRADALALVAERAVAAGMNTGCDDGAGSRAVVSSGPAAPPLSGTRAARYQVVLHVDAQTLATDGEPGRSELDDGTRVSAETSRRMACDASVLHVAHDDAGNVLDLGRRTRTVSPALRRALEVRDGGCRFPGCGLRFADAHHVRHWADGGETSLANCLLLCSHHHRLVHEGGWQVRWWGSTAVFVDPRGGEHVEGRRRTPQLPADAVSALVRSNMRRGVHPHSMTAGARWRRETDIPEEVWRRASEAV